MDPEEIIERQNVAEYIRSTRRGGPPRRVIAPTLNEIVTYADKRHRALFAPPPPPPPAGAGLKMLGPELSIPPPPVGATIWLDAFVGMTKASPAVPISWLDQSGNARNVVGQVNFAPTIGTSINSRPSADWSTSGSVVGVAPILDTDLISVSNWTIGAVLIANNPVPNAASLPYQWQLLWTHNRAGAPTIGIGAAIDTGAGTTMAVEAFQYDGAFNQAVSTFAPKGAPHYLIAWYDGATVNISLDNSVAGTAVAGLLVGAGNACIWEGGDPPAPALEPCSMGEFLSWNRTLTVLERTKLAAHFHLKWGI